MKILAIETSCDDTCVAILKSKIQNPKSKINRVNFEILSNIVSSQVKIHQKWGGVYPTLAKREHQRNLIPVLKKSLKESNFLKLKIKSQKSKTYIKNKKIKEILEREDILCKQLIKFLKNYQKPAADLIAVTAGPGLDPCLWVGVNFAKALSYFWELPIVPVNHIEAHIIANWLTPIGSKSKITPYHFFLKSGGGPAICLVVSGGHTQLILMKDFGRYEILGETRDDAAGECFDKVAKILDLGYPGGPAIAKIAKQARQQKSKTYRELFSICLPRPMIYQKNYDFSFSGLKTAVLYDFKKRPPRTRESKQYIQEMCFEIQQAIIDVLIYKTLQAAKKFKAKAIILGGGVAANDELRKQLKRTCSTSGFAKFLPPKKLCTDNAAMVATAGYYRWLKGETKPQEEIKANANLRLA